MVITASGIAGRNQVRVFLTRIRRIQNRFGHKTNHFQKRCFVILFHYDIPFQPQIYAVDNTIK